MTSEHSPIRFLGRVAIVTGAGCGLGRIYAIYLASLGAKIVVNDLGTSTKGKGQSTRAADAVVSEIKAAGGEAIADYHTVTDGDRIIASAMQAYGRVDILINNAGILRDVSFGKMSDEDWEMLYQVHLYGSYKTTRAAWPHMMKQGYGRILMVTSAAGLYGNFGQANYGTMKLALLGLTKSLSIEGKKYGIVVNAISPIAASRMTETVLPPDLIKMLQPEHVLPLVAFLTNEHVPVTGQCFEVGAGWISAVRIQRTRGVILKAGSAPEDVRNCWSEICDFSHTSAPRSLNDGISALVSMKQALMKGSHTKDDPDPLNNAMSQVMEISTTISPSRAILYALSVGDQFGPTTSLDYVYENASDFRPLPFMALIYPIEMLSQVFQFRNLQIDPTRLFHAEQHLILHTSSLPSSRQIRTRGAISSIVDKGKAALMTLKAETSLEGGPMIATNYIVLYLGGLGGRGNRGSPTSFPIPKHSNSGSNTLRIETLPWQALLYRQSSSDMNPIHVDPNVARAAGFDRPIIHGLCTLGTVVRALITPNTALCELHARFVAPVYPGETLIVESTRSPCDDIIFVVHVERDGKKLPVVSNAWIVCSKSDDTISESAHSELQCGPFFARLSATLEVDGPTLVKMGGGIYQFQVTTGAADSVHVFTLNLKQGSGSLVKGPPQDSPPPDVVLKASDQVLSDILGGRLGAQPAFFSGKLKIQGNIGLAAKLDAIFQKVRGASGSKL